MKSTIKLIGIIALIAVIGFSFFACDSSGGNNGTRENILIEGDARFVENTQRALNIIQTGSPASYVMVLRYIGILRQGQSSGMWAWLDPPVFVVGPGTSNATSTWYASAIVHDAIHSKQYHDHLAVHGHVPDEVWTGLAAEMEALDIQIKFLIKIGAPQSEIDYAKSLFNAEWWDGPVTWSYQNLLVFYER